MLKELSQRSLKTFFPCLLCLIPKANVGTTVSFYYANIRCIAFKESGAILLCCGCLCGNLGSFVYTFEVVLDILTRAFVCVLVRQNTRGRLTIIPWILRLS